MSIEKLAFSLAPKDTFDNPAFPNFSDTDIWVDGFKKAIEISGGLLLNKEVMSPIFTKYHIKGLPFNCALHHFTGADQYYPHDHPWDFTTYILSGGYIEEVFHVYSNSEWHSTFETRMPGDVINNQATQIHRMIGLVDNQCWTLVKWGENKRETRFWNFDEPIAKSRLWNEENFK